MLQEDTINMTYNCRSQSQMLKDVTNTTKTVYN